MIENNRNTGFIDGGLDSDYISGINSPIVWESRNSTANWDTFLDVGESQHPGSVEDWMDCVSESAIGDVECTMNWLIMNNLVPAENLKFLRDNGYLENGRFRGSVRFTAKMSKTTRAGNTFTNVWGSIKNDGVVPMSRWTRDPNMNWDNYYVSIPQEVIDLGQKWKEFFKTQYEQLYDFSIANLTKHLKHSPIQFSVATGSNWFQVNVPAFQATNANHAIFDYAVTGKSLNIRDSYNPFNKVLGVGYQIFSAMKGIVSPIPTVAPTIMPATVLFPYDMTYGQTNLYVGDLQRVLKVIEPVTGYYGRLTQAAVWKFQQDNRMANWFEYIFWHGKHVTGDCRNLLNKMFS